MMYEFNSVKYDNIDDLMSAVSDSIDMSDDDYEEILNDTYAEVEICGYMYSQGTAIRELDNTAFRVGKSEEIDNIITDLKYDIEHNRDDEYEIQYCDDKITVIEDEEIEDD